MGSSNRIFQGFRDQPHVLNLKVMHTRFGFCCHLLSWRGGACVGSRRLCDANRRNGAGPRAADRACRWRGLLVRAVSHGLRCRVEGWGHTIYIYTHYILYIYYMYTIYILYIYYIYTYCGMILIHCSWYTDIFRVCGLARFYIWAGVAGLAFKWVGLQWAGLQWLESRA